LIGKKTVLRSKKNALKYASIVYQIGELEKQFKALYPPVFHEYRWINEDSEDAHSGYWIDSWITKRPKKLPYTVNDSWRYQDNEDEENKDTVFSRIVGMANRLREARANIRALTPPEDEKDELAIAA
jgi:hypothetical protein